MHDANCGELPSAARQRRARGPALAVLAGLACVQPLAQCLGRVDWHADLLSHFPEPALAFTVTLLVVALRRRSKLAAFLLALAAWQAVGVFGYARPNPVRPDPTSNARLKVLLANVLIDNDHHEELAQLIEREQPDIVGLVEFTHDWQAALHDVREDFETIAEFPAGASGLALWFRRPALALRGARRLRPEDRPFLHARFEFAGAERHFFLLHPRQPLDPAARHSANPELAALAREVARAGGSRVVAGDMNTSDGSLNFKEFLRTTGLRDSRFGFGRQGSFPAFSPYRIAIDHALVTPDLAVVERRLGPRIGSDHYPLIVVFAPASGRSAASTSATRSAPPDDSSPKSAANFARSADRR